MYSGRRRRAHFVRTCASHLLPGFLLLTPLPSVGSATECHDVRTGQAFGVPSARFSAAGAPVEDIPLLSRLCVGALDATYAVPISDGTGGAFVAWIESAAEDCDLRVQHVEGSGQPATGWPEGGRTLCGARGTQSQPVLALAVGGGLWAAWKDYRQPACSAIYLAKLDASGDAITGWAEGGVRTSSPGGPASDPALVPDGSGGVWVLWQQGRPGTRNLRLKHYGADGVLAAGWPSDGISLTPAGADAVRPIAAAESGGGFVMSWVAPQSGGEALRVARFDATGSCVAGWSTAGVELGSSSALLLPAAIVMDSVGVFVAWAESFGDSSAARVARLGLDGQWPSAWTSGGQALGAFGAAAAPAMTSDGAGGAYVCWSGPDSATGARRIQLQRLTSAGNAAPGWPEFGLAIPGTSSGSSRPRLLPVEGGVLASWSESSTQSAGVILSAAVASLGALPEIANVEVWPDLVKLTWRTDGESHYVTRVERRGSDPSWVPVRELSPGPNGDLQLVDREITPGEALTYRLRLNSPQMELVTGELTVVVPAQAPLAIKGVAVESGRLRMIGSVPGRGESRFELFDVQGRRLLRDVRQHEHAGEVKLDWPVPAGVRAGVFFARFSLGHETKTRRFVVGR